MFVKYIIIDKNKILYIIDIKIRILFAPRSPGSREAIRRIRELKASSRPSSANISVLGPLYLYLHFGLLFNVLGPAGDLNLSLDTLFGRLGDRRRGCSWPCCSRILRT